MPPVKSSRADEPPAAASAEEPDDFRRRAARAKREKMLGRLLAATMEVCADTERRGTAVIDDVVKAAGVSRGAFYWYFDSLEAAIEMLGRRLADEVGAETRMLFQHEESAILRSALGGQVLMCRARMDKVWARFLSNVPVLLDDSSFVMGVRRNLEAGKASGDFAFGALTTAVDFQIGAVLAVVRRCAGPKPPPVAEFPAMNAHILQGLGVPSDTAQAFARRGAEIVEEVAPGRLSWWKPARSSRAAGRRPATTPEES